MYLGVDFLQRSFMTAIDGRIGGILVHTTFVLLTPSVQGVIAY